MTDHAAILDELLGIEDLEFAQQRINSWNDRDTLRRSLVEKFHEVVEYDDAAQWLCAVRLCELLALLGWDGWERVDAFARYSGDCWQTGFFTYRDEPRFRHARWTKRKAGWTVFNPEYHFSPDRPDAPSRGWRDHEQKGYKPVALERLSTQRNYLRRMPFSLSAIGGSEPGFEKAAQLRMQLSNHLTDALARPDFGDAVEHFYITLHPGDDVSPPLSVGAYRSKAKAFSCELAIPPGFAMMTATAQKEFFRTAFIAAIEALRTKLRRKKIPFDFEAFVADVHSAFDAWNARGGPV